MCLIVFTPAVAQSVSPIQLYEQKIKAGLVYNFLKFTKWPEDKFENGRGLNVCLYGGDSFDGYLHSLNGRTAQQLEITIQQTSGRNNTNGCHLLFLHSSEADALPEVLPYFHNRRILTMSDIPGFADKGGMVEVSKQEDQRIHMLLNERALSVADLFVDERLRKLAEFVE